MAGEHRIITFGLSDEQNEFVRRCFPGKDYELFDTDAPTDLIAISATAYIINAAMLKNDSAQMLFDFYDQVNGCTNETVIWLDKPLPPVKLQTILKCYDSFGAMEEKLKYILLSAHTKTRKSKELSKSILYALKILAEIRKHPGVTSDELAEICEISPRSVQRYIETLRCAGEWIEYDVKLKGWKLFHGISILFDDVTEDEL